MYDSFLDTTLENSNDNSNEPVKGESAGNWVQHWIIKGVTPAFIAYDNSKDLSQEESKKPQAPKEENRNTVVPDSSLIEGMKVEILSFELITSLHHSFCSAFLPPGAGIVVVGADAATAVLTTGPNGSEAKDEKPVIAEIETDTIEEEPCFTTTNDIDGEDLTNMEEAAFVSEEPIISEEE